MIKKIKKISYKRNIVFGFWILVFSLYIYGCGYTTRGCIYPEGKILIVPAVNKVNITSEDRQYADYRTFPILVEKKLTNKIIEKFNINGELKVVNREGGALKLYCTISDYRKDALRYDKNEDIWEQKLRLDVQIKLISSKGETLKEETIVGDTDYFLSGTGARTEESAQTALIDDAARRILEAVIEAW